MALLVAIVALSGVARLQAQTVFQMNNISASVAGANTNISATNSDPAYNISGPTSNNITALTFGSGFSMLATGPTGGTFDNSFKFAGSISGSSIAAATALPISYNFTLAKSMFAIPGDATWVLKFSDSVNTGSQQIATGTLSTASATFTGAGSYSFTSGVNAGATFLATLQITYFGNIGAQTPEITGTMLNTGFGQQGITLNASAIPEPSTYAAIVGALALGVVMLRRRARTA